MWKNIVEPDMPQMTIWRMRIVCWIPKTRNTNSDCVILIAFLLQQWYTNAPQCYVIHTLPVLSDILLLPCLEVGCPHALQETSSVSIQVSSYWGWTTFVMLLRRRFTRIWEFRLRVSGAGESTNAATLEGTCAVRGLTRFTSGVF
jgi:hypothetical protein